jgi:hypothetical protein
LRLITHSRKYDPEAFVDSMRQRLLDVNVLPYLHGVDHHTGVPVVGRGDDLKRKARRCMATVAYHFARGVKC